MLASFYFLSSNVVSERPSLNRASQALSQGLILMCPLFLTLTEMQVASSYGLRLSSPLGSELNVRPSLFSYTILHLLPRTVTVTQPVISKYVLKERACG